MTEPDFYSASDSIAQIAVTDDPEDGSKRIVSVGCPSCGEATTFKVNRVGYARWQEGELIKNALPELSAYQREALITGICSGCFNEICNAAYAEMNDPRDTAFNEGGDPS